MSDLLGDFTTKLVEYYDPRTNLWHNATPMKLNRSALGVCVIRGLPNNIDYSVLGRDQQDYEESANATEI